MPSSPEDMNVSEIVDVSENPLPHSLQDNTFRELLEGFKSLNIGVCKSKNSVNTKVTTQTVLEIESYLFGFMALLSPMRDAAESGIFSESMFQSLSRQIMLFSDDVSSDDQIGQLSGNFYEMWCRMHILCVGNYQILSEFIGNQGMLFNDHYQDCLWIMVSNYEAQMRILKEIDNVSPDFLVVWESILDLQYSFTLKLIKRTQNPLIMEL
jgi:hypothetical protein